MSIGSSVLRLQRDIAASLFMEPATLEELRTRDFLRHYSEESVDRMLMRMESKGWIFINPQGRYQTYKKIAATELADYELGA